MNTFDAVIIGITLVLALKGFFNGFIKEIAGLIGIAGGLYLASKYNHQAGAYINEHLISIQNSSAIDLVGYVFVFISFWLFIIFIGFLFSKILKLSALGIFDRLLGFVFSGAKFFIIVSVIVVMLNKIEIFKEKTEKYTQNSITYPILLKVGEKIINLSPKDLENNLKNVKIPKLQ